MRVLGGEKIVYKRIIACLKLLVKLQKVRGRDSQVGTV